MLHKANHLSFSRVNTFLDCSEKYNHRYILKSPVTEPAGDYMHVGKFTDYSLLAYQNQSKETFQDLIEQHKIQFQDEKWHHFCHGLYAGRERLYNEIFSGLMDVDLQKKINMPVFDNVTGEILQNEAGEPLEYVGYLDGYDSQDNKIYEVKTVASIGDSTVEQYVQSGQMQLYAGSIIINENGENPKIRLALVKKPQIRIKKTETENDFFMRMLEAGKEPEVAVYDFQFSLSEIMEVVNYYKSVVAHNMLSLPYKNRRACVNYGNKCEYYNHCWKAENQNVQSEVA